MREVSATLAPSRAACPAVGSIRLLRHLSLLAVLGLLVAFPAVAQKNVNILTGVPINFASLTLHVAGSPITVYEFTVSIYPMNTKPPWPVGLWLYNYVEVDPDSPDNNQMSTWGQTNWCRWWIYQVANLEQQNGKKLPYPFFEMNLPSGNQQIIITDEQIPVYRSGSVTCWQAENDYAP
jgi:hypothetical protein